MHRFENNKIRKVTVIDWASDNEDGMSDRGNDLSINLKKSIRTNAILEIRLMEHRQNLVIIKVEKSWKHLQMKIYH